MTAPPSLASWDPEQYVRFAAPRLRPAVELLARVPADRPERIFDLGCGEGGVTALLAARWPRAELIGIDGSEAMIERARAAVPQASFVQADLRAWRPPRPADVIFSNAALHWLDDHAGLFKRLMAALAPGGTLAVQMPRNHLAPSHTLIVETVRDGPWRDRLEPLVRPEPVASPAQHYEWLAPLAPGGVDIWETEYLHVLEGSDPVAEWTKGAALRPFLDALGREEGTDFFRAYAARLRRAYPPGRDGRTLFPFRRLFIVART